MARTALEEWDAFGVFEGPPPSPATHLTIRQYVSLVQWVGQRLKLDNVSFRFNLLLPGDGNEDAVALRACGHPPVCVHLAREEGLHAMQHPDSLPTIACDKANTAAHALPHVHCLFCLRESQGGQHLAALPDLHQGLLGHYMDHMQTRNECLALLEGEAAVCMSEAGWEPDLSRAAQQEKLEHTADSAGRHGCFIASVGTATCPVVVVYCAVCDQLAPLATFVTATKDAANNVDSSDDNKTGSQQHFEAARSVEEAETILARLLLACQLLCAMRCEPAQAGRVSAPQVQPETHIFLATPLLFGVEKEALTEEFESGAVITHSSVILPMATLGGPPEAPQLCLMDQEAMLRSLKDQLPPYCFTDAVVGFMMAWPTEADTDAKVAWVLRQDGGLRVQRRLAYVEDTDEWVIARVFYHPDTALLGCRSQDKAADTSDGGIRVRNDCCVFRMLPLTLLQQYTFEPLCTRAGVASYTTDAGDTNSPPQTKHKLDEVADAELLGCPYSAEARTIQFFAGMMALAKAMKTIADHVKENQPYE
ncbi:hypothetical protein TraAM80_04082 [Trypanosoma rangeli]|uniref:Uncharacterized protein n=1 Tax=Trypanosoma rangeli TaxID=5698 RepID=A0A422NL47_TRYRA|nr:uncharacterized protein TraAM80_04082 [Trypanosoma rangeli]RNF06191.1 hypothetical protein TraAM80_04082 [Trypanosoma rangeli]|eukprot:RNF06191.1 hypothetical protein TraAM80_04082 [Trypanosoma rangeli]